MKARFITVATALTALVLSGCYDKFDPESYQPVFTIGGYAASDEIEPSSLVAYWSFEEEMAEAISGVTPTVHEVTQTNGFVGQAASFNANSPSWLIYETPEAVANLESFTISFWVNPTFVDNDANNAIDGIIGLMALSNPTQFWGNLEWFIENNSNPESAIVKVILINNNDVSTDIVVSNYQGLFDAWTNHTLTYDAATATLTYYVNGSQLATKTAPWTGPITFANNGPIVFGTAQFQTSPSLTTHGPEDWASHLTGTLDEVRIYNKALSAADINALVVLQGKGK